MGDCGATSAPFVSRRGVATQPSHHMDSMRKQGECQESGGVRAGEGGDFLAVDYFDRTYFYCIVIKAVAGGDYDN